MKILILLLAVLAGVWLWKRGRRLSKPQDPPRSGRPGAVQPMLSCPVCGVHFPKSDAVAGRQGSYCSVAHRDQD
ncbi:PP0621 family protein [Ottowia thiooxydans]|uniref:PP0621 family protein n=1 Tax=Ottowia thiooxydans TaxID=219182 RepID=UPI0012EB1C3C|nr:PP0621 family protein [Ottowia thiooxydans]